MIEQVDHAMLRIPGYQPGDTVVIITGSPPNQSGSTNLIRVHRLSHNSEPMQVLGIQRGRSADIAARMAPQV